MNVYSITYDLRKIRDYNKLYEGITSCSPGNWAKPTESQWFILSNKTASQINTYLSRYIDNDDVLMVVKIDHTDCAATNIRADVRRWLGLA